MNFSHTEIRPGRGRYYPGTLAVLNSDGTYGIRYDDGKCESRVEMKHIRLRGVVESGCEGLLRLLVPRDAKR